MIAEGHRMREIADLLRISEKTGEYHKYRLMKPFSLMNTPYLLRFAIKSGLVASAPAE
ncbi:MAG: LuxR C-terminal-related transcriptional regulator [Edaphobacter sp.]